MGALFILRVGKGSCCPPSSMMTQTTLYDESGMLKTRIQYVKGLKQGVAISYDPMGRVKQILYYAQDLLDGPMASSILTHL